MYFLPKYLSNILFISLIYYFYFCSGDLYATISHLIKICPSFFFHLFSRCVPEQRIKVCFQPSTLSSASIFRLFSSLHPKMNPNLKANELKVWNVDWYLRTCADAPRGSHNSYLLLLIRSRSVIARLRIKRNVHEYTWLDFYLICYQFSVHRHRSFSPPSMSPWSTLTLWRSCFQPRNPWDRFYKMPLFHFYLLFFFTPNCANWNTSRV